MKKKTHFLLAAATVLASVGLFLVVAEVVLRFLPVSEGLRNQPVTREQPVALYVPDDEALWSQDWNFSIVNRQRVNRQGFVNRYDYAEDSDLPVLAVIGDSYVQASMVTFDETLHGRLEQDARTRYGGRFRVYSFGLSGAPLSQYLVYAQHAQDEYNVRAMVFVVVGNDFDQSLPRYRLERRFQQFRENDEGELELFLPREYESSPLQDVARRSSLVRYLYLNLSMADAWRRLKTLGARDEGNEVRYVGNTDADMSEDRLEDSRRVVDAFLRLLPRYSGLSAQDVAFIVDAPRRQLYGLESMEDLPDSYFSAMRAYFIEQARRRGYEVLDMAPYFFAEHKRTDAVFEFPTDGHWNGEGHRGAYETFRGGRTFERFLSRVASDGENADLSGRGSAAPAAKP